MSGLANGGLGRNTSLKMSDIIQTRDQAIRQGFVRLARKILVGIEHARFGTYDIRLGSGQTTWKLIHSWPVIRKCGSRVWLPRTNVQ